MAEQINKLTVAGAGVLGSQIAFQSAYWGKKVTIWVRSDSSIERAKPKLDKLQATYQQTLEKMKTDPKAYARGLADSPNADPATLDTLIAQAAEARGRITFTTSIEEAARGADVLIEAIAEDPAQKIAFYGQLAPHLQPETVVATNSSTMLPSTFAAHTGKPANYLAMHFANNIWANNTAEIMGHADTSPESFQTIVQLARDIHMVPLELKKEQPGYLLNSLLVPLLDAAQSLLANGVSDYATIDKAWCLGTGAPMGPFRIMDVVGLTTVYNVTMLDPRSKEPGSTKYKVAQTLKTMIGEGKTGVAAGEGFYRYK